MDRLGELLLEWEERRDRGDPATPESLCPDDAALATELAEQVRLLEAFDRLMGRGGPSADPPAAPLRVGKYEVREVLGRGGMGVVYGGWDPALRRPVAVKMIRPQFVDGATGYRLAARFAHEGRVLAQLKHPNVVSVYDAGVHGGQPFLAMEYVPGGSLAAHRGRLTAAGPGAVVPLVEKIARAVQFAHDRGVLHRDLKPANILLGPGDEPLVADFGLAKLLDPGGAGDDPPGLAGDGATTTGSAVATAGGFQPGTPGYMAPEQLDPAVGPVGPEADVWAIGVILHELLTGRKPTAPTPAARPRTPRPGPAEAPGSGKRSAELRDLLSIADRCLAPRPLDRYRSAGEVATALAEHTRTRRVRRLRRALAAGGLATALCGGVGLLAADPERRYRFRTAHLIRKLRAGEAVELIRPGLPVPAHRVRLGGPTATIVPTEEGVAIRAVGVAVFELLPEVPNEHVRIEAEIRHDLSDNRTGNNDEVGLVFAAAHVPSGGFVHHLISRATFNDWAATQPYATVRSLLCATRPDDWALAPDSRDRYAEHPAAYPKPKGPRFPMRTLCVEVTPVEARMTFRCGDDVLHTGPLTAARTGEWLAECRQTVGDVPYGALVRQYTRRVGLFVAYGRAVVRALRVVPLG